MTPKVLGLPAEPKFPEVDEHGLIEAGQSRRGIHFLGAISVCRRLPYFKRVFGLRDSGDHFDLGSLMHLGCSHIAAEKQWPGQFMDWREAMRVKVRDVEPSWDKHLAIAIELAQAVEDNWVDDWEVMGLEIELEIKRGAEWITARLDMLVRLPDGRYKIVDFKSAADATFKAKKGEDPRKAASDHFSHTPQFSLFAIMRMYAPVPMAHAAAWVISKNAEQRKAGLGGIIDATGNPIELEPKMWAALENLTFDDRLPPGAFDRTRCAGCWARTMCLGVKGS